MLLVLSLVSLTFAAIGRGPCEGNDDRFKCDKNGFFQKIQKQGQFRFCVSPHNGAISYDTRTKGTPKCGPCTEKLHELFKNGQPKNGTFVPLCEDGKGFYDTVQCNHSTKKCSCADQKTGKLIKGSEKKFAYPEKMNCDGVETTIDTVYFPDPTNPYKSEHVDQCELDFHRGETKNCKEKPSIRYHFSRRYYEAFPFEYSGCGGNENNFKTSEEAWQRCSLSDNLQCSAGRPAPTSDNQGFVCGTGEPRPEKSRPKPKLDNDGCPEGYKCVYGNGFGICCSNYHEQRAAEKPKCKNGKKPYATKGAKEPYLAVSCDANHCPKDHSCETNYLYAFCCPK